MARRLNREGKEEAPGWRDRLKALRYVMSFVRLVWRTRRGYTVTIIALRLCRAFAPVSTLWIGKLIIDTVIALRAQAGDSRRLGTLIALEMAIVLANEVLSRASSLVESLLGDLFTNHTSVLLMEHAARLDLYHFEDPLFYDKLERARRQTNGRIGLLTQLLSMAQDAVTLISLGAALFLHSPWLLILLAVTVLPGFLGETHFASLEYSLLFRQTPQRRLLDYIRFIGTSDRMAKEVQLFGMAPWLVKRHRVLAKQFYDENKRFSIRKGVVATLLSSVGTGGYYGAYVITILRAVRGVITLGSLTFLVASFARSRDLIQRLLSGASDIFQQGLYLKDLFDFFEMKPTIASPPGAPEVPSEIRGGFVFEDVGFRYPGSDRWAVRHVSFRIRPGERLALVGENGAGKTTLTKLLARLYDPTEGRILLEGRDLREYDLESLRHCIGVIFQDFIRYDLRFDENIGIGGIGRVETYLDSSTKAYADSVTEVHLGAMNQTYAGSSTNGSRKNGMTQTSAGAHHDGNGNGAGNGSGTGTHIPPPIVSAAEKSLASSLLSRFPEGYRQMLGSRFEGGVDLSGGEWQKIAIARAYMRDAQLLILDEPTAALDARAECEVFKRFAELVSGRMAISISHRFSTVRMADRIIVFDHGTVAEEGTHDELLARGGLYADLFTLQAEGYR